jgi:hypothetical protein
MLDCNSKPGDEVVLDLSKSPATPAATSAFPGHPERDGKGGGSGSCDSLGCCATLAGAAQGQGFVYYPSVSTRTTSCASVDPPPDLRQPRPSSTPSIRLGRQQQEPEQRLHGHADPRERSAAPGWRGLVTQENQGFAAAASPSRAGQLSCSGLYESSAEQCNGLDDDRNGSPDDGIFGPEAGVPPRQVRRTLQLASAREALRATRPLGCAWRRSASA